MKQSTFKKKITANGEYGSYTAEIIATMNYSSKNITGTHALTHDDFSKSIPVHKVEVFVNIALWKSSEELQSETEVFNKSEYWIGEAQKHIRNLADTKPIVPFVDKMKSLFGEQ